MTCKCICVIETNLLTRAARGSVPIKFIVTGLILTFGCWIQSSSAHANDKRSYSLWNPTPDALLRDMTTDRPDITEVPFTIDAGRVQIESNVLGYARSRPDGDGVVSNAYEIVNSNIRIGLTHNTEASIIFQPYGLQRSLTSDGLVRSSGTGALLLRGKFNLWGNDTFEKPGSTALALLPYISVPSDRTNGISPETVSGGLQTFFAIKFDGGFSLGINAGLHAIRNPADSAYHSESSGSASLGYEWTPEFTTYGEVAVRLGTRDPLGDIAIVGGGMSYKIRRNIQIDGGINFGVTRAADRINPFLGLTVRF